MQCFFLSSVGSKKFLVRQDRWTKKTSDGPYFFVYNLMVYLKRMEILPVEDILKEINRTIAESLMAK